MLFDLAYVNIESVFFPTVDEDKAMRGTDANTIDCLFVSPCQTPHRRAVASGAGC